MTEQDRSMITLLAQNTINVRKQCDMTSRYAVKHGGSTRVSYK